MNEILTKEDIKKIRQSKNMSRAEFAKKIGYSRIYIEKIERGRRPVTKEFVKNLLFALDLEGAYKKACNNFCEINEVIGQKSILPKLWWLLLAFFALIWILLY